MRTDSAMSLGGPWPARPRADPQPLPARQVPMIQSAIDRERLTQLRGTPSQFDRLDSRRRRRRMSSMPCTGSTARINTALAKPRCIVTVLRQYREWIG